MLTDVGFDVGVLPSELGADVDGGVRRRLCLPRTDDGVNRGVCPVFVVASPILPVGVLACLEPGIG